ncbi:MAG: Hsp20/alpha crystallin family protein [Syntrophomonadales bacterium]|jgi:HSP20 family protein
MKRRVPASNGNEHPLAPWFNGLDNLHNEIDRWFSEFARGVPGLESLKAGSPRVEIVETNESVLVNAELPGIESKDVDVRVFPQEVRIKAERRQEREYEEEKKYRSESYYGSISRTVSLPTEINPDQAAASFKNGILKLVLPKIAPSDTGRRLIIED